MLGWKIAPFLSTENAENAEIFVPFRVVRCKKMSSSFTDALQKNEKNQKTFQFYLE
jgi:hypothetical protein